MSAATIAASAAVIAANSSHGHSSPGPALWMLIMVIAMIPWAIYLFSDHAMNSETGPRNSMIALLVFGVVSAGIIMATIG
ncbi:hypothetical protein [Pseudomonas aeruginosa]|uniref:hypothetical protein n=1 Tax=Pseudomonas aeruginosa TaxID=287 RepID=UPI002E17F41B|nr:hypothetical protein [Pseudomonas aeruginosa]